MINIIIMGIGKAYEKYRSLFEEYAEEINILCFIDNGAVKDQVLSGLKVRKPEYIVEYEYDGIFISSNKYREEMNAQLIELGVTKDKIWNEDDLKREIFRGKKKTYGIHKEIRTDKKNALILTTNMDFAGGIMVSVYAALALKDMGYNVRIAAPSINYKLLVEIIERDISVTVWSSLPYIYDEDRDWIEQFDFVLVNVFQMMNCVRYISEYMPVLWWIHEVHSPWVDFYRPTQQLFDENRDYAWMNRKNLKIVGVSKVAEDAFDYFYPGIMKEILPFGIPNEIATVKNFTKEKMIIAVIAGYAEFKGQDILIDAMEILPDKIRNSFEIWFIGPSGDNKIALEQRAVTLNNVKYLGKLAHDEVLKRFSDIDIVICPSLIESMSMTVVEGMMNQKICIASNGTGIADYIEDGKNGYIFENGNSISLARCLTKIAKRQDNLNQMRKEARKCYDKFFSMQSFEKSLDKLINE